jgi:Ca-activated chloride channel family protein
MGAPDDESSNYAYTRAGNPLDLRAQDDAGAYELRYISGRERSVLAVLPITVSPTAATLEAAPNAASGAEISVSWTGPDNQNDFITVVPLGTAEGESDNYTYTREGNPLTLRLPDAEGDYELRYLTGQDRNTLASLPITLTATQATLEASPTAPSGSEIAVTWTGPDNRNDFITVVPIGTAEGESENYTYTREGNPLTLRLPDAEGAYELRYLTGQDRNTLARLPITLIKTAATIEASPIAQSGAEISVTWTGPDNRNDFITVVPVGTAEGESDNYTYTREGNPLTLRLPEAEGAFELRYLTGQDRNTLASLPITLQAAGVTLQAEGLAVAGSEIEVTWTGPDNRNDFITIVAPDAPEGASDNYTYTREGNPLRLRTPDSPGTYEIRYLGGQDRKTLGAIALTLVSGEVTLNSVPTTVAGASVSVTWEGPDNQNDYLVIVPAGSDEGESGNYTYTREGSPLDLRTPDYAGAYEIRYISGQSRSVRAALPIILTEPSVSLAVPPSAGTDSRVEVTWTGPDNQNDYIVIVPAGADEGESGNYTYTREGNPMTLRTPKEAGSYELRYISGQSRIVLASAPLRLTDVEVTLQISGDLMAAAEASVVFTGPSRDGDYLTIVPVGSPAGTYVQFYYTTGGSPGTLTLPDVAGTYELRYVSGGTAETLGQVTIEVSGIDIYLDAPEVAPAGTVLSVLWDGPDNPQDYITIVPVGAPDGSYVEYFYTSGDSPATLTTPATAGAYEIRYVSGQTGATMGSRPLTIE